MEASKKVTQGRLQLILPSKSLENLKFWGSLALRLTVKETTDVPTAATDGKFFYYNPAFVDKLSTQEMTFLWVHEVAHCALRHMWRVNDCRHIVEWKFPGKTMTEESIRQLHNVAADFVVNIMAKDQGLTLIQGALFDEKYRNLSVEQVFEKLLEDVKKNQNFTTLDVHMPPAGSGKDDKNGKGGKEKGEGSSGKEGTEPSEESGGKPGDGQAPLPPSLEEEWKQAVVTAAAATNGQGNLPGEIQRMFDAIQHPSIPWRQVLAKFVLERTDDDYKWYPVNKRMLGATGWCFPSIRSNVMHLAVAVDTSGSIGQKEINEFFSEVSGILDAVENYVLTVVGIDTRCHDVLTLTPEDDLRSVKFSGGGGGTDFTDFFRYLDEEADHKPAVAIYLTDGYGSCSAETPEYPVLWVYNNKEEHNTPFGDAVFMEIE